MKSIKRISVITLVLLFLLISNVYAETGKITSSTVRVREKSSTSSEILTNVHKNDTVEVLEKEGDWYKVKANGKTGYIKSDFITVEQSEETNIERSANATEDFYTTTEVKLRALPNILSVSLGNLEIGKTVTKLDEVNNWVKISNGVLTGWVNKNKVSTEKPEIEEPKPEEPEEKQEEKKEEKKEEKTEEKKSSESKVNKIAIVNVKTLRLRDKASTSGEIIDLLDYNDEITILAEEGTWYKVKYGNKEGYVDSSCVVMKDEQGRTSRSLKEERQQAAETIPEEPAQETAETPEIQNVVVNPPVSGNGQAVVDFAMQFMGYPYVAAGKKPETGFDCSGFTGYIFSNFGYSLGGSAASQANSGTEVPREGLVAGDLLLFYDEGKTKIGHTGIYIENGNFIHAANPKRGVVIDNINTSSYYNERYISARRLVQ